MLIVAWRIPQPLAFNDTHVADKEKYEFDKKNALILRLVACLVVLFTKVKNENSWGRASLFLWCHDQPVLMSVNCDVLIIMLTPNRTYEDCEFRPGPHLNVLLGPNGMKLMFYSSVHA